VIDVGRLLRHPLVNGKDDDVPGFIHQGVRGEGRNEKGKDRKHQHADTRLHAAMVPRVEAAHRPRSSRLTRRISASTPAAVTPPPAPAPCTRSGSSPYRSV
jgi:hypothetical protein